MSVAKNYEGDKKMRSLRNIIKFLLPANRYLDLLRKVSLRDTM